MTGGDHHHRHKARPAAARSALRRAHSLRGKALRLWSDFRRRTVQLLRLAWLRHLLWGTGIFVAVVILACAGLWWRLSTGPIELDLATPWLKAAMEKNFGPGHTVVVGGTQLERDEKGGASLRLRDIVVRDADGVVVASAPKAEVSISGQSLLSGQLRARSINLVGAEMSVRIETDGRVTVFAGAESRPIATAMPPEHRAVGPSDHNGASPLHTAFQGIAGAFAWVENVGASGLEGHDLHEIGLKNGNLVVEDKRNGKRWTFDRINASLTRPGQGGVIFKLESDNPARPWVISAAMRPLPDGNRAVGIEARKVVLGDILLALRLDRGIESDLPLSASVRAEIANDGTPRLVQGQLLSDPGSIVERNADKQLDIKIDRADFRFNWDARRRSLLVPFQIQSGGNQFTLLAALEPSADPDGPWTMTVTRGDQVIDPIILAGSGTSDEENLAINRATLRLRLDPVRKRIDLEQGDFRRSDTRPSHNIGIAITGSLDFAGAEPHLAFGVAATRMPLSLMKRLWPVFVASHVRNWVDEHMSGGSVERVLIAGNAPIPEFQEGGPPLAADGLSVEIETSGTTLQPISDLPPIRDADLTVYVTGSRALVNLGRGTVEVAPGRKLGMAGGVFEVPDTHLKPAPARVAFRLDGTLPAAAALLASDALNDNVGLSLDPATMRGTVTAQVSANFKLGKSETVGVASYAIAADLTNVIADKLIFGQKLEAASLKVNASQDGYQIKGDVKINGAPANVDVQKRKAEPDAEVRLTASIDESARRRLGINLGGSVTGSIPVKVNARFGNNVKNDRMTVEADLAPVKIDNLLPGWVKAAGKQARATYVLTKTPKLSRFDDLTIDGAGATVRGSIELDAAGDIVSANFPVYSVSDGDKLTLKAERNSDGALRVVMRGDIFDGRNFVKSSLAGDTGKGKHKQTDLDLDIKVGTVLGHNGETLRGLDLRLSRRAGHIRIFNMAAKIGRDTPLTGDLRVRVRDNHQVLFFETDDAGALFRFTDMYPRMIGGQMRMTMDPPTQDQTPQAGTLYIRNLTVRGEPALERVVSGAPNAAGRSGVDFTEVRAEFTRFPGKMSVRDGVVRGPLIGATVEGNIDYVSDDVHLRGTFVPLYGINNMFGQIPIVGLFLGGGSNEGLLGITYEAVGPPSAPRITVNPVSAIAPGLLRKFIPSPSTFDRNFLPPTR